jgi:hypothetical protein
MCEPPIRIDDMMNMSVGQISDYIGKYKTREKEEIEQTTLIELPALKKEYTEDIRKEIARCRKDKDILDIFAKYPKLHNNYKFNRDLGLRKKEIADNNFLIK